jgi:TNFR/NGFR cysteine-rich region
MLGRNSTCDACEAGKYSFPANIRGASSCALCTSGTFSLAGAANCTACPAGTFGVGSVSACTACPAGKYALSGASVCTDCSVCAIGQYNVSNCNSSADIVCASCTIPVVPTRVDRFRFTSSGSAGRESCAWCCNGGFFAVLYNWGNNDCIGTGISATWAYCGIRYGCPDNSRTYTVSPGTQTACTCNAGFTGEAGWNSTWQNFPAGVQLQPPANWSGVNCEACPAGKYNTGTGVTMSSRCVSCGSGTYSTGLGVSSIINCTACQPGTYLSEIAASSPTSCTTCQTGTYSTGSGMTAVSNCTNCSVCATGQYNVSNCISSANIVCAACANPLIASHSTRYYFTGPGYSGSYSCPFCCLDGFVQTGVFPNTGCWGVGIGNGWARCGIQYACPGNSTTTYQNPSVQSACRCNAGFTGVGGWNATIPRMTGQIAPPANWSGVNCEACPAGTYNPSIEPSNSVARTCLACDVGTYSTGLAVSSIINCTLCQAGTYLSATAASSSSFCLLCQSGTYSTTLGANSSSICAMCTAGKYGTGLGFTAEGSCSKCSSGTFSVLLGAVSAADCSACSAGQFSIAGATACGACSLGFFSVPGNPECTPCYPGTFNNQNKSGNCSACAAGTYSTGGESACLECSPGQFSRGNQSVCTLCPPGGFNDRNASGNCSLCEPGRYSTGGSSGCLLCSIGFFTGESGRWSCSRCQDGSFAAYGYSQVSHLGVLGQGTS